MVFIAVLENLPWRILKTPPIIHCHPSCSVVLTIQGKRAANNITPSFKLFKQQFPLPLEEPLKPMQILSGSSLPLGIGFSLHGPLKEKSTPTPPELPFHPTWQLLSERWWVIEHPPRPTRWKQNQSGKPGCLLNHVLFMSVFKGQESWSAVMRLTGFRTGFSRLSKEPWVLWVAALKKVISKII